MNDGEAHAGSGTEQAGPDAGAAVRAAPTTDLPTPGVSKFASLFVFLAALGAGILVRLALMPTSGVRVDLDDFARWTAGIASMPLGRAYDLDIGFPPVMVYVWAALAALESGFQGITNAGDPWTGSS